MRIVDLHDAGITTLPSMVARLSWSDNLLRTFQYCLMALQDLSALGGNPFPMAAMRAWYSGSSFAAWRTSLAYVVGLAAGSLVVPIIAAMMCVSPLSSQLSVASPSSSAMLSELSVGFLENASGPLCHLPGLYWIVKRYGSVLSFRLRMRGFLMLLRSRSRRIPVRAWWSVETSSFSQPRMKNLACSRDHAMASASPSVGE